jgi:hypothetical protein
LLQCINKETELIALGGGGGVKRIVEGGDYTSPRLELGLVFHLENGGIPLRRIITNE